METMLKETVRKEVEKMETMENNQKPLGMKWYKFIIYVALILGAIVNILGGVRSFAGMSYGSAEMSSMVYAAFPGMKALDIIMGVLEIGLGAFCFIVRSALAHFKAKGPKLLLVMYIVNIVILVFYSVATSTITGLLSVTDTLNVITLAPTVIMVIVNYIYFNNRSHLFVN